MLIHYLLNFRKHSNQVELDQFFKNIHEKNEACQHVTKSAFFQARKQISHTAFIEINQHILSDIYKTKNNYKTWKGFRVCAIDGTSIRLPNEPGITDYFGFQKGKQNQADCPMGMASVFYDLLNNLVIDSCIKPNNTSERNCAEEHLKYSNRNDLIIYDRGYTGFWFYTYHIQHNLSFCVRAKTNQDIIVKEFIASNKKQALVTFSPGKKMLRACQEKGLPTTPVTLRLVRVDLPNEVEVLITNLTDESEFDVSIFKSLYHMRWGIEENYKRLKQWVEIENFSGKSVLSVKQDFHAKIVAANLTSLIVLATQKIVVKKTSGLKLEYKVNFSQALSKMKHRLVYMLRHAQEDITVIIHRTIRYISQTTEAVRDGRSAPRKLKNIKNDIHFPAYKSSL